jgi:hypothetical protein
VCLKKLSAGGVGVISFAKPSCGTDYGMINPIPVYETAEKIYHSSFEYLA